MAKDNRDFFVSKSEWAKVKDDSLESYLKPYLSKILSTGRPLSYVDCFAGKGMFEDGEMGSPLIACECIKNALSATKQGSPSISAVFADANYAAELETNISSYSFAQAVRGSYGELSVLLQEAASKDVNLFLYVDPFGIKDLDFTFFLGVSKLYASVEVLLNFNAFGFFREACHVLDVPCAAPGCFGGVPVDEPLDELALSGKGEEVLTKAAGGEYWKAIVCDYREEKIDGYAAEQRLVKEFCQRLREAYGYVLSIPICMKQGNHSKYYMVHASCHEDGCLLMYDNMYLRLSELHYIQTKGQTSLFDTDAQGEMIDVEQVKERLLVALQKQYEWVLIEVFLARFVEAEGLALPLKELRNTIKEFEQEGRVEVKRQPPYTKSKGQPSSFMSSRRDKNKYVWVRCSHA